MKLKRLLAGMILASLLGPASSEAVDLSKLKGESVRVSPNGNYAMWCRITKLEWLKNSWRIPLYPFVLAIGKHNWSLTTNFKRKCTIVDKDAKDLFEWRGSKPLWSPDGNWVSSSGAESQAHFLPGNNIVPIPAHSFSEWLKNNVILLVTRKDLNAAISTFDVATKESTDVGIVPLPDWTKYLAEINLCGTRLKILVQDEYAPSGLTKSSVLDWDVSSRTLVGKREFERSVYGMIDVRKCER